MSVGEVNPDVWSMPQHSKGTPRRASGSRPSDAARLLAQCGAGRRSLKEGVGKYEDLGSSGVCEGVRRATKEVGLLASRGSRCATRRSLGDPTCHVRRELDILSRVAKSVESCPRSMRRTHRGIVRRALEPASNTTSTGVSRHQSRHQRTKAAADRQHALRTRSDGQRPSGPRIARH
jgi:hypothetical protein